MNNTDGTTIDQKLLELAARRRRQLAAEQVTKHRRAAIMGPEIVSQLTDFNVETAPLLAEMARSIAELQSAVRRQLLAEAAGTNTKHATGLAQVFLSGGGNRTWDPERIDDAFEALANELGVNSELLKVTKPGRATFKWQGELR